MITNGTPKVDNSPITKEMVIFINPILESIRKSLNELGMSKENVISTIGIGTNSSVRLTDIIYNRYKFKHMYNEVLSFLEENSDNLTQIIFVVYNEHLYDNMVVTLLHNKIYNLISLRNFLTEAIENRKRNQICNVISDSF